MEPTRLHFGATSNPRAAGVSFSQYIYLDFLYVDRSVRPQYWLKGPRSVAILATVVRLWLSRAGYHVWSIIPSL